MKKKRNVAGEIELLQNYVSMLYEDKKFQKEDQERIFNHLMYGVLETNLEMRFGKENVEKLQLTKLWKIIDNE